MHYVICYDLENDRLREKLAKILQRQGCNRVQKSVFFAPDMNTRQLEALTAALRRLSEKMERTASDNLLIIPLPDECARGSKAILGLNNILATLEDAPLKILL